MKIIEKIKNKSLDIYGQKPVTIAFLGDSVTQGCFECYKTSEKSLETVFDVKSAYSTRLKELLAVLYPKAQVNIINSGISGDNARNGAARLARDIAAYSPDMVVVSFGLNDSCGGVENIEAYVDALRSIFTQLQASGAEIIFLTQNYMNTKTSCHLTDPFFIELAEKFAKIQNEGILKKYFETAKTVCAEYDVRVCDLYSAWEKMAQAGVDITELLSNKFNHPIREYHYYIAIKLLETMLEI